MDNERSASTYSVPETELNMRISQLQKALQKLELDGALILEKTDLFYFSGTSQHGWLYVPASELPVLMVFKDYRRACAESALKEIVSISGTKKIPQVIADYGYLMPAKLGMELDVLPTNQFFQFSKIFNSSSINDIAHEIRLIRAVKSAYEIEKICTAARLSDVIAKYAAERICPGKTEVELAGEIEAYARSLGHQGLVRMRMFNNELFYGHLMSGDSAAVPSYLASPTGGQGVSRVIGQGAGFKKLAENEPILLDYVFALDGYLSDHARIYSIGRIDGELENAHAKMVELQDKVKILARPGISAGDLYEDMIGFADSCGLAAHFMGVGDRRIRFTGHGVGLELDEYPFIAKGQQLELQAGMVIALEPKAIFPGKGVVGIESTHLITDTGLKTLSSYPDTITVLNEFR